MEAHGSHRHRGHRRSDSALSRRRSRAGRGTTGSEEVGPSFVGRERLRAVSRGGDAGVDRIRITISPWPRPTEETVLGDFNDVEVEYHGITSRFYRRDGGFFVHTEGPGGEMGDFEIAYTFGHDPLQQYLVPFPGGRLQCLSLAWDSVRGEWFHLYPDTRDPARRLAPLDPQRPELERDVRRVPLDQSGQGL